MGKKFSRVFKQGTPNAEVIVQLEGIIDNDPVRVFATTNEDKGHKPKYLICRYDGRWWYLFHPNLELCLRVGPYGKIESLIAELRKLDITICVGIRGYVSGSLKLFTDDIIQFRRDVLEMYRIHNL